MPQKIILENFQSPGDIVMLTAAVRDLHACYPGEYSTDVQTSCPELWYNNPLITPLDPADPEVQVIPCHYPLINSSNHIPKHFIFGFIEYLNDQLGIRIQPTLFKGDIHLSKEEKSWISQIHEITGWDTPFWLIVSGGKYDFTTKWWDYQRYQKVVDHFRGKIQFVQVGLTQHYHPKLNGVIDLRDKTDLRQLIRLVYHAQGIISPVSLLMHLASAVEVKPGMPKNRPCVVIAGGREPVQWEAYPHHQFLHTNGALLCCDDGGCWRARVKPLGDGDEKDQPENLCVDVVNDLPRCMDMISANDVIRSVELYFRGESVKFLPPFQAKRKANAPIKKSSASFLKSSKKRRPFGVYTVGDENFFPGIVASINSMRYHGYKGPIAVVDIGFSSWMKKYLSNFQNVGVFDIDQVKRDIKFVDIVSDQNPVMHGWAYKAFSILYYDFFTNWSFLDADYLALCNPEVELRPKIERGYFVSTEDGQNTWTQKHAELTGVKPGTYVNINAGFINLNMEKYGFVVQEWKTLMTQYKPSSLWYGDQGALNIILDKYQIRKTCLQKELWNQTWLNSKMAEEGTCKLTSRKDQMQVIYTPIGKKIQGWHGTGPHKLWHQIGIDHYRKHNELDRNNFFEESQGKSPQAVIDIFRHFLFLDRYNEKLKVKGHLIVE